ncbi:MAG: response regulator transcription factor [Rhodocyclaceae bacterium]|jgi:FixJ family two-component response regulator|nr:response regulator transcription factor [Rhodocyclaceae bacterium]
MNERDALIYVVDDDAAMRDSLSFLLDAAGWRSRAFATAQEFFDAYQRDVPGCLVLDVMMPLMGGLEVQRILRAQAICLPVIFLTAHGDLPMAVQAMKRGAIDFLEKPCKDHVLLDAVGRAVRYSIQQCLSRTSIEAAQGRLASLTQREREVAELLAAGDGNKTIARKLSISDKTVQVHRHHAMEKLGVHSTAEIARLILLANATLPQGQGGGADTLA